uniref:Uncharacterized protein n=1 Tax=Picea glauca TaxID=3330 RepID=A0A101M398_PICGL|nr:hypothetical protein ABT39_MTgene1 [Picea glauca]
MPSSSLWYVTPYPFSCTSINESIQEGWISSYLLRSLKVAHSKNYELVQAHVTGQDLWPEAPFIVLWD